MLYFLCTGRQVVPCSTCSLCLQAVISALYYNKVEYQHIIVRTYCGSASRFLTQVGYNNLICYNFNGGDTL